MVDGVMAQFDSAYNACLSAVEIQQTSKKEFDAKLRIGIHLGEIVIEKDDIFSD